MTTRKKPAPKEIVPYRRAKEVNVSKTRVGGRQGGGGRESERGRGRDLIIAAFHEELQRGLQSNGQHYSRNK